MKKLVLSIVLAHLLSTAAIAEDACKVSVDTLRTQAPEAAITVYDGATGIAMRDALSVLAEAPEHSFDDVTGVVIAELPDSEAAFVGMLVGQCLKASAVLPKKTVRSMIEATDGKKL